jgi:capsular exopolysaccharide synthesis family protein
LVTSAGPSEGKTTVACSLAIAMAQAGQSVLLVDCDLRRPRLHKVFRRSNAEGVNVAVIDPQAVDLEALRTEVDGLSLLSSGPHAPSPAELLQSDKFAQLLDYLSSKYDRIVLDSPPLVPVTDAAIVATQVDASILVIRGFKTTRDLARQALRSLRDVGVKPIGAVLNAVDLTRKEYTYYQYYYYKHEGYGDPEALANVPDTRARRGDSDARPS